MGNYHVRFCSRAAGATSPLRHLTRRTRLRRAIGWATFFVDGSPSGPQLLCHRTNAARPEA
jgi:hypothetical protein